MDGNNVAVREAQPADAAALGSLVAKTLGDCLGDALPEGELEACTRAYTERRAGEKCYVAEAGGTLAGYAVVAGDAKSPCGAVRRLYVRRDDVTGEEDREVAAALVAAARGGRGDREVPIATARDTGEDPALDLYDRWGFVDVEALQRCLSSPSGLGRLVR